MYMKAEVQCGFSLSPPWEFPSVPGSNSPSEAAARARVRSDACSSHLSERAGARVGLCMRFFPDSQGSAELNPLKCPPGFCPHVSAEFPCIHPTIQALCVRALWNALGLTGA